MIPSSSMDFFSDRDLFNGMYVKVNAHWYGQDHDHDQERAARTTWNDVEQRALRLSCLGLTSACCSTSFHVVLTAGSWWGSGLGLGRASARLP